MNSTFWDAGHWGWILNVPKQIKMAKPVYLEKYYDYYVMMYHHK